MIVNTTIFQIINILLRFNSMNLFIGCVYMTAICHTLAGNCIHKPSANMLCTCAMLDLKMSSLSKSVYQFSVVCVVLVDLGKPIYIKGDSAHNIPISSAAAVAS